MRWVIKYAVKSMKQNWLRNMLIALGAALGVMLATMLLLGNQSVEKSVKEQVVSRYGDYNLQFGYIKNDMYLNNESLKGIDGLENAEKYQKYLYRILFQIIKSYQESRPIGVLSKILQKCILIKY